LSLRYPDVNIFETKAATPINITLNTFEQQKIINKKSPKNKEDAEKNILEKANNALKNLEIQLFRSLKNHNMAINESGLLY